MKVALIYFFVINLIGFFMMGIDKKRSIKKEWRIPEKTLFITALIGGGIGTFLGMYTFRHKTKHWYFVVFMPIIALAWVCIVGYLLKNGVLI